MKRILLITVALVMVLTLAACGGIISAPSGSKESGASTPSEGNGDTYPRYTGFDGTEYVAAANLQNCHILYTYDDECHGDPSSVLTGEYMTCLDRQYFRTYTLSGYDEHRHNNAEYAEPDNHLAYVFKDGKWTVYDFYLKIIATDGEPDYHDNAWTDGIEVTSFSTNTLRHWELYSKDFEPDNRNGFTEHLNTIVGKTICGRSCDGWMRYDTFENGSTKIDTYDYREWVDPETHLTLRYEWYVDRYNLDEVAQVFEVTDLKLNCVTQEDFDSKIADLVQSMGGEGEFEKMLWGEYWELFE